MSKTGAKQFGSRYAYALGGDDYYWQLSRSDTGIWQIIEAPDHNDAVEYFLVAHGVDEFDTPALARAHLHKLFMTVWAARRLRERIRDKHFIVPQFGLLDRELEFQPHPLKIEPLEFDGHLQLPAVYASAASDLPFIGGGRYARQVVQLVASNACLRVVMELFSNGPDIRDIFSIIERIGQEFGPEFVTKNFGKKREFSSFANNPELSGFRARHQKASGKAPKAVNMTDEEAFDRCCNLIDAAIRAMLACGGRRFAA